MDHITTASRNHRHGIAAWRYVPPQPETYVLTAPVTPSSSADATFFLDSTMRNARYDYCVDSPIGALHDPDGLLRQKRLKAEAAAEAAAGRQASTSASASASANVTESGGSSGDGSESDDGSESASPSLTVSSSSSSSSSSSRPSGCTYNVSNNLVTLRGLSVGRHNATFR